jgi:hypothetical protein
MNSFNDDHLLVFCCEHVFRHERPVLYVCREDGDWQFLCGQSDHSQSSDPLAVGVGHLIESDPSLSVLADLPANCEAERKSKVDEWVRTPLQPDQ